MIFLIYIASYYSGVPSTLVIDILFIEYVSIQLKRIEKAIPKNVQVKKL